VAARAGVPFHVGRASDGLTQPMTMFFRVGNVDGAPGALAVQVAETGHRLGAVEAQDEVDIRAELVAQRHALPM